VTAAVVAALAALGVLAAACGLGHARELRGERERASQRAQRVALAGPFWSGRFGPDR
jgi:hypothetical protein